MPGRIDRGYSRQPPAQMTRRVGGLSDPAEVGLTQTGFAEPRHVRHAIGKLRRGEPVALSDGTIATGLTMRKIGEKDVLLAPLLPSALRQISKDLRGANHLRHRPRAGFARRAADAMAAIDPAHPFREGNGRTQCVFMYQLAAAAGHSLDFSVVSARRPAGARFAARNGDDDGQSRSLFGEISDPARAAALPWRSVRSTGLASIGIYRSLEQSNWAGRLRRPWPESP